MNIIDRDQVLHPVLKTQENRFFTSEEIKFWQTRLSKQHRAQ